MTDDDPLDLELGGMLRREGARTAVPEGLEARLIARLGRSIPHLSAVASAGPAEPPVPKPTDPSGSVLRSKAFAVLAAFGVGAMTGGLVMRAASPPVTPSVPVVPTNLGAPPSASPPLEAPPPVVSVTDLPSSPSARSSKPTLQAPASDSVAERRLLDAARTAMTRGEIDAALRTLAEHARTFPHGYLEEEREALAVRALAEASRYVEARGRAQSFRSRWPKSVLLPAVEAAVAAAPEDGATGR